jgi:hypothetical protein
MYCHKSGECYKYHCALVWFKRSVAQPDVEVGEWFGRPAGGILNGKIKIKLLGQIQGNLINSNVFLSS